MSLFRDINITIGTEFSEIIELSVPFNDYMFEGRIRANETAVFAIAFAFDAVEYEPNKARIFILAENTLFLRRYRGIYDILARHKVTGLVHIERQGTAHYNRSPALTPTPPLQLYPTVTVDLANVIGAGTAASADRNEFATASQGAKADTALQKSGGVMDNDAAIEGNFTIKDAAGVDTIRPSARHLTNAAGEDVVSWTDGQIDLLRGARIAEFQELQFANNARIAANAAGPGLDMICSIGYIHRWIEGRLEIWNDNLTYIRVVMYALTEPNSSINQTNGHLAGCRWIRDNGDEYILQNSTLDNDADWLLQIPGIQEAPQMTSTKYSRLDSAWSPIVVYRNEAPLDNDDGLVPKTTGNIAIENSNVWLNHGDDLNPIWKNIADEFATASQGALADTALQPTIFNDVDLLTNLSANSEFFLKGDPIFSTVRWSKIIELLGLQFNHIGLLTEAQMRALSSDNTKGRLIYTTDTNSLFSIAQGLPGSSANQFQIRYTYSHDFTSDIDNTFTYLGKAPFSAESDAVWLVTRVKIYANGSTQSIPSDTYIAWTNRTNSSNYTS
jgi:hypothetical protein